MSASRPPKSPPVLTKKHQDRLHREKQQTRWIVIGTIAVIAAVILLIVYGVLDDRYLKYMRPVAHVNGETISAEEFRGYTKYYRASLIRSADQAYQFAQIFGSDPSMLQNLAGQLTQISQELDAFTAGEKALNQMVDNKLIIQEAKKRGITLNQADIEQRLQEALGYFANGTPTPTNTVEPAATSTLSPLQLSMMMPTATVTPEVTATLTSTLETTPQGTEAVATEAPTETATPTASGPTEVPATATITPTATPYTLEGYQGVYATLVADYESNFEVTEDVLRYVIETEAYRQKLQEQVIGEVPCTEEQVWAQHILVPDAAIAKVIKDKLDAGEDWFKLVTEYSTDSSKTSGGDLGWFGKGRMVAEFETAAFALEVGQVSEPVQSQFGYHIIRVLGHEDRPLTESECSTLAQKKFDEWVLGLRGQSKVELLEYWKQIVPLRPVMPAELMQVIQSLQSQGLTPQQPQSPLDLTPQP
jgi:parvulin-like peptidyl-prolyl isomerase